MQPIKTLDLGMKDVTLDSGKVIQAKIKAVVDFDLSYGPYDDLDDKADIEAVECGLVQAYIIEVTASFRGLCGNDILGAVLVPSADFNVNSIGSFIDEYGMVGEAVAELKKNIEAMLKDLIK